MHWLERWRKENGMSQYRLGRACRCSAKIIDILENQNGGVTHWRIADRIADYTGATPAQRDSMVAKRRRGTYTPDPSRSKAAIEERAEKMRRQMEMRRRQREERAAQQPDKEKRPPSPNDRRNGQGREVLLINSEGRPTVRYPSLSAAAEACGMGTCYVQSRCIEAQHNEFIIGQYTFRYADQWNDAMAEQVRAKALAAVEAKKQDGMFKIGQRTYITLDGETRLITQWAKETGIAWHTILDRIKKGWDLAKAVRTPCTREKRLKGGNRE